MIASDALTPTANVPGSVLTSRPLLSQSDEANAVQVTLQVLEKKIREAASEYAQGTKHNPYFHSGMLKAANIVSTELKSWTTKTKS